MKQLSKQAVRKGLLAVSAAALALMAGVAQAAPISAWTFSTDTNFTSATFSGGAGSPFQGPDELSWGDAAGDFQAPTGNALLNRSALTIGGNVLAPGGSPVGGGPVTGGMLTDFNGTLVPSEVGIGTSITHWNNPIDTGFAKLTGGVINDTLTLFPAAPAIYVGGPSVPAPTLNFNFTFQETPNGGNGAGLCADGALASSFVGGCPDLIGFTLPTLNLPFQYFDVEEGFDRTYFASVLVLGDNGLAFPIQTLTAGECAAIGLGAGCFGFRTPEVATTTIQFAFSVTGGDKTVPEPASLALFGLALAGLAVARARKQS